MEPRISIITLGVADLERSLRFYRDGLGLPTTRTATRESSSSKPPASAWRYIPTASWPRTFRRNSPLVKIQIHRHHAGPQRPAKGRGRSVLKRAEQAGAKIEKPASDTYWGGYSGYFSDPDGYLWEVAWGAFKLREDGSLIVD